ncbi:MAG: cell division protein ZapA [Firmicutes bacterium]|nr:cell division protein ZapA [Bacillota bacterium]
MGEINKVTVMVYGQEYTLSGDMPRDYVLKLADKVDTKMRELDDGSNTQPKSALAVLAGMLIADEYYTLDAGTEALQAQNQKLAENAQSYERMWEELKANYAAYKEEVAGMSSSRETLQRYVAEKDQRISSLSAELEEEKRLNDELRAKVEELIARVQQSDNAPLEAQRKIQELETRCRDIESSFFDIQMENIHLKNDLEAYRNGSR